jgi:hypothetical protein
MRRKSAGSVQFPRIKEARAERLLYVRRMSMSGSRALRFPNLRPPNSRPNVLLQFVVNWVATRLEIKKHDIRRILALRSSRAVGLALAAVGRTRG